MKTALAAIGQLLLFAIFLGIFFAGGILTLFHLDPFGAPHWFVSHPTPTTIRYFVPSGLLLMTVLFVLVLLVEAAARAIRNAGRWTALAYVVALVLGLLLKFGWGTFPG